MTTSRRDWPSIKRIVAAVLERSPSEQAAFVAAQVGDDDCLRAEVEGLVRAAEGTGGFLCPRLDRWVGVGGPELSGLGGQRIGRYLLDRLIAEGSTAAVYEATQDTPHRKVAVKVLRDALPLIDAGRRFDREASALGRLSHPNVARIYEAGRHRTESGGVLPFLAMEFVDGPPITQFVREQRSVRDEIVRLAIKVASAVHAAHQQAIIHRDLKPANVLVDRDGEPKVLDFGIARLLDGEARTWRTSAGILLGTPGYMSPEQAAGRLDEVDVRTDVWAVGVLLYEMLSGRLPIDIIGLTLVDAVRRIERDEPTPLSRLQPRLSGDLNVVVMTALARDKDRRYVSAAALADDLARVLRNEPIAARAPSTLYRLKKFAGRNRAGLGVALAFLVLAVGATGLLAKSYVTARRERDRAAHERDRAKAVGSLLRDLVSAGDPNYGDREAKMIDVLKAAEQRISQAVGGRPEVEADVRSALGEMYFGLGDYERSEALLARAIELRRRTDAPPDPAASLGDQNALATTLRWLDKTAEARALAELTVSTARTALGEGHLVTLTAMEILAGCEHDAEDLASAETKYRAAVNAALRHLGEDHQQSCVGMGNLANVLSQRGRFDEAERWTRRVIDSHARRGTLATPEGLAARHNLASLLLDAGRTPEALIEFEAVSADAARVLGPGHDSTLRWLSSLSEALRRTGQTDRGLAIAREIVDRRVAALGWSHEYTHNDVNGYTAALLRTGRYDQAYGLSKRAVAEAEKAFGRDDIMYHRQRLQAAAALSGLKRYSEAQAIYRDALDHLRRTLGEDHRFTLIASNNFGLCFIESGDGEAARQILEPTLVRVLANTQLGMEPVVRRNLGNALRLLERFDEAETQLMKAWELSTARGEAENAAKVAEGLVALFADRGDSDRAAEWARRLRP